MLGLFYNTSLVFEAYEIQSALHEIKCQVIFKVMDSDVATLLRRTVIPSSFFILALAENFFLCSAVLLQNVPIKINKALFGNLLSLWNISQLIQRKYSDCSCLDKFRQLILHRKIVVTTNKTKCIAFGKNINHFDIFDKAYSSLFL